MTDAEQLLEWVNAKHNDRAFNISAFRELAGRVVEQMANLEAACDSTSDVAVALGETCDTLRQRVEDHGTCGICGSRLAQIRARYPDGDKRIVCPTCLEDRMNIIREYTTIQEPAADEGEG